MKKLPLKARTWIIILWIFFYIFLATGGVFSFINQESLLPFLFYFTGWGLCFISLNIGIRYLTKVRKGAALLKLISIRKKLRIVFVVFLVLFLFQLFDKYPKYSPFPNHKVIVPPDYSALFIDSVRVNLKPSASYERPGKFPIGNLLYFKRNGDGQNPAFFSFYVLKDSLSLINYKLTDIHESHDKINFINDTGYSSFFYHAYKLKYRYRSSLAIVDVSITFKDDSETVLIKNDSLVCYRFNLHQLEISYNGRTEFFLEPDKEYPKNTTIELAIIRKDGYLYFVFLNNAIDLPFKPGYLLSLLKH